MGAGGRVDPAKVIVTDLSMMQWDRTAIRNAKRAGNRSAAGPIPHEVLRIVCLASRFRSCIVACAAALYCALSSRNES